MAKANFKLRRRLASLVLAIALVATLGYVNRVAVRSAFDQLVGNDYLGGGYSSVLVEVNPGDTGASIAHSLVQMGVVKNYSIFYKLVLAQNPKFYPGTYQLKLHMSSSAALSALLNPANSVSAKVTIKEGLRNTEIFSVLSAKTGVAVADFEAAAKNRSAIGLPSDAVSAEGYLFPATYTFTPKETATEILKTMVNRMQQELDNYGVSNADRNRVLTLASMIQKEARQTPDFYKVSRVFLNRIKAGMHLQSDATVSYGVGSNTVNTTVAQRADPNGYNTYLHPGLPIGPISAPGSLAIDAALHPVAGSWLYFCAINLATGETVFSTTIAEHQKAVAQWRAWMKEHPGYE